MSRLDDLIDLIQTTNEVYFITAPGRVRTAYILVDDIIELSLKTFLQGKALDQREQYKAALEKANLVTNRGHRTALDEFYNESITINELSQRLNLGANGVTQLQGYLPSLTPANLLQHWSVNDPDNFPYFPEVVRDVKLFFGASHIIIPMLDDAADRHRVRNKFYHDHQHTGLTIDDDKCLRSLCGMFILFEQLFPDFHAKVQTNNTVRCQIGVLRLKLAAHSGANELVQPYNAALEQLRRGHQYDYEQRSVEHSLVHTVSYRFFNALREQFISSIGQLQLRVDEINRMSRTKPKHLRESSDKQQLIKILQSQLTDIESFL